MSITRKLDEKLCWVSDKGGQRDCTTTDLMALGYVPAPRGDAPAPANAEGGSPKELWLNWYPENPGNEAFGWAKTTKQECLRCTSGAAAYCGEPYLHLTYVGEMIREERAMLRDELNAAHAKESAEREAQYTKESTEYRTTIEVEAKEIRELRADLAEARDRIRALNAGQVSTPTRESAKPQATFEGGPPKEMWVNWYDGDIFSTYKGPYGIAKPTLQLCLAKSGSDVMFQAVPYVLANARSAAHEEEIVELQRKHQAELDALRTQHEVEMTAKDVACTKESTEYRKAFASAAEDMRAIQADIAQARDAIRAEQAAHEQEIVALQQEHQAKIDALRAQHEAEMTASTLAHAKAMTECNLRLAIRAKGANIGEKDGKTIMAEHPAQRMAREALAPLYAWINWRAPIFEEFAGDAFSERQLCVDNWHKQKLHKAVPYVALSVVEAADDIVRRRITEARDMVRRLVEEPSPVEVVKLVEVAKGLMRQWAEEEPALRAAEGVKS